MEARERAIRQRLKSDFVHYAARCLKIRTKKGEKHPLVLNDAQVYIHERLEAQLVETGKVRALILKGRQQGASTYVEARFYHRTTHRKGVRAFILTHMDDASSNIFEMAKRYHEHCPALVKPSTSASNAKELVFDKLDSGYKIATAGSRGTGRSATLQYFHGSEVAYWPNAETHFAGALQAVPDEPGTEVVLESTSAGPDGLFYQLCKDAAAGVGEYQLIFVPWFWQKEYRKALPPGWTTSTEEREYADKYGVDELQLAWRRSKIIELGGLEHFRREYPADVEEAFSADAKGALWNRDALKAIRVTPDQVPPFVRIVIAIDPSTTNNKNSAECGIMGGGLGTDGRVYVLRDSSLKAHPADWAAMAISDYHDLEGDLIVAEVNNGGEMVQLTIHSVDNDVPVKQVRASRGKQTRAEPVATLYQRDRVRHVGHHPALENQMCTWVPGRPSPDRVDALVWLITELLLEQPAEEDAIVEHYDPVEISPY